MNSLIPAVAVLGAAGVALGQHAYTITLDVRVSDPVLTVGESQHVEVWAIMDPDPPGWYWIPSKGETCYVGGLGGAWLNLRSVVGAETGEWSDLKGGVFAVVFLGEPQEDGSVVDIRVINPDMFLVYGAPIMVWSATWTPCNYSPRSVSLLTEPAHSDKQSAWINCQFGHIMYDPWDPVVTRATFQVGCAADCEGDGDLDLFDFLCFQEAFAAHDRYADCEGDGDWDPFDFLCYQGLFFAGCG